MSFLRRGFSLTFLIVAPAVPLRAAPPTVSGTVLDPTARPIADASIQLLPVLSDFEAGRLRLAGRDPEPLASGRSDAAGRFLLQAPGSGVFKVTVRSQGTVPIQYAPLAMVENEELPPAVLAPDAGARLRVVNPSGRPLAGVWLFATSAGERQGIKAGDGWTVDFRLGPTAADGSLILPRRAGEKLDVSVFPPRGAEEKKLDFDGGTIIVPAGGGEPYRLRVVTPQGRPAPGVLARVGDLSWPVGLTDAAGYLQVPRRPGEPARLRLVGPGGHRQDVELPASTGREGEVSVVLSDPAVISGRVTSGATPLAGALVRATADPGAFVITDAQGQYRLVAPDLRLQLQAMAPRHLSRTARVTRDHIKSGRAPLLSMAPAVAIHGQVLDVQGAPLADVALAAVPEPRPGLTEAPADRASSDAGGRFELRRLQADRAYGVRATRLGYLAAAVQALVAEPSQEAPLLKIVLAPARAAQGRVRDDEGRPIAGAEALLTASREPGKTRRASGEAPHETRTDEKGGFAVAHIPARSLDLAVRKPGYVPAFLRGIRVPPGAGAADLGTVVLRPGARLNGRVADPGGRPVSGAEVFQVEDLKHVDETSARLKSEEADAITTQDGRFVVADLPKGPPLNLLVRARGYLPSGLRGVRAPNREPVTVQLVAATLLVGRLIDEAREPVAGARIELMVRLTRPVFRTAVADRQGRFEIRDAPPGAARLSVQAQGFVPLEEIEVTLPQPEPGRDLTLTLKKGAILTGRISTTHGAAVTGARVSARGSVAVSDDEGAYSVDGAALGPVTVEVLHPHYRRLLRKTVIEPGSNRLDVTFEPGVEVAGQVVDGHGEPVPGAWIALRSQAREKLEYTSRSAADGTFRLSSVAQGRYRLRASQEGYAPAELKPPVAVAAEPVSGLEIALGRGGAIAGRVLGLAAEELAQVAVEATRAGSVFPAVVDSQGSYAVRNLEPGDYLLRASLAAGQRQVQARVPLGPGEPEVTRDLEFIRRLTLSGQLLYGEKPLPDAVVMVRGSRFAVERSVVTDYAGGFSIEDLDPDVYWLGVSHLRERLVHNDTVKLTEDRGIIIRLRPATVSGRVVDAKDGRPVAGALILLRHPAGAEGPEYLFSGGAERDGSFMLSHVPPGTYRLTARADGYALGEREVAVVAGPDPPGLEVPLTPTRGLEMVVRLASGRVPEQVHVRVLGAGGGVAVAETRVPEPSGILRLSTVPEGNWTLLLSAPGGSIVASQVTVPGEPTGVTLPEAGRLRARVPALAGSNLVASLTVQTSDQQPFWILGPGGIIQERWRLIGGTALVEGLPAGLWQIRVEAPDGQVWTRSLATSGRADAEAILQ